MTLRRGGPLRRLTPLPRSAFRRAPGPEYAPPAPKARRAASRGLSAVPAAVAAEVRARSRGRCEVEAVRGCRGEGQHLHHRAGRGPGRDRADLLLDVCWECHAAVHRDPAVSYARGWMISRVAPLPPPP